MSDLTFSTNAEDRKAAALESIARSLTDAVTLFTRIVDREYPVKPEPTDATITRVATEQDELLQSLGSTGEQTVEEWIGLREEEVIAKGSEGKRDSAKKD